MLELPNSTLDQLRALCERRGVARLELTGSAARDDFDPARSDIDLLIELQPQARMSALAFVETAEELSTLLGRPVDLIELRAVRNPILRERLSRDRRPFYAAA